MTGGLTGSGWWLWPGLGLIVLATWVFRTSVGNGRGRADRRSLAGASPGPAPTLPRFVAFFVTAMLTILSLQFILGMYLNLYVSIPSYPSFGPMGSRMLAMMALGLRRPWVMVHLVMGVLILGLALAIVAGSALTRADGARARAVVGALAVSVAAYGGMTFLMAGQHNGASFLMAAGWLAAFLAYLSLIRPGAG